MKRFGLLLVNVLIICLSARAAGQECAIGKEEMEVAAAARNGIIEAVEKFNAKDFKGAVELLEVLIEEEPENDAACYYMALSKIGLGEKDIAEAYLERAVELDPANFWYRYRLAAYYGMISRSEEAIKLYQELLKEFPKKSQIYYDLYEIYVASDKKEEALEVLDSIEDVFGASDAIVMQRFNLLLMMERQEEAISTLKEYNEHYSSPFVLTTLADYEMSVYNDSLAHRYYDEVLDIFPDYAPAMLGKAEAYRLTRKEDEYFKMIDAFVSSTNIGSREKKAYLEALVNQSLPVYLKSVAPKLEKVLDKALEQHPADSLLLPVKGMFYLKIGQLEAAEETYRIHAAENPESISARATWCDFLAYQKKWEKLASEAGRAASDFPDEPGFIDSEIYARYNLEQWPEIIRLCKEMLAKKPADKARQESAWSTMGDVYFMAGMRKEAFRAYDRALKLNPDNVYVLNNYAYYLSLGHRRLKKAAAMSKKTVEKEPDNATYLDTYAWILYLQGKPEEAKPLFKHAMLYGGKDSAVIMDHYAEVLYKLGEYDLAFVYWNRIGNMEDARNIPGLDEKIAERKAKMKKKK